MADATASVTDHAGRPVVAITGIGVISSLGVGVDDNWRALTGGKSGIKTIRRFPIEGLRSQIAGTVDAFGEGSIGASVLTQKIAEMVAEDALNQAAIGTRGDFPGPLFLAIPPIETEWPERRYLGERDPSDPATGYDRLLHAARAGNGELHRRFCTAGIGEAMSEKLGTKGAPISLTTACASGATAIQLGVEALRRGESDAALVVATDASVHAENIIRFNLLSALSTQNDPPEKASKPFSKNRDGFIMAEGAAALVLETYDAAKARGATILGVLAGCGEKSDGFHRTRSNPNGAAIIATMNNAITDAGISPDAIDYVNAHGTSTPENDKMEHVGVTAVFGDRAPSVPISSNKSMIGHTITAAGAIEAVFSLLTIRNDRLPPTINHDIPDPAIDLDVVPNTARDASVSIAMSNSFGFGGQNSCLIIAQEPVH